MPLESSVTVAADLNASWPLGTDDPVDGDNHIRYCKVAIKSNATVEAAHEADVANPHSVTKAQVGLTNVSDDAQLKAASNLSDVASAATSRTNLGIGPPTLQVFTANGTWTKPTDCKTVKVTVIGGGGGGANGDASDSGAGGGGGGCAVEYIDVSAITDETVTIGAGGAAEVSGGNSSFGTHCYGNGGGGATTWYGFSGGNATGGDINIDGGDGSGGKTSNKGGKGGDSFMGFGGAAEETDNGNAGKGYGAGGGGAFQSASAYAGGAGSSGIVTVEEYY